MYQLLTKTFAVLGVFTLSAGPWPAWAGTYKQLYAFQGGSDGMDPQAGLVSSDKLLYGTTSGGGASGGGTVFSVDPTTGSDAVVHSFQAIDGGATPYAGLIKVGTKLYGTTLDGGAAGYGT